MGGPSGEEQGMVAEIVHIAETTGSILEEMKAIPGMYDDLAGDHHAVCRSLPAQIRSGLVRVAVVGAIKSGKSTCINALVGDEILKRGAGVVTAMVTRIRHGEKKRAVVFLKSWDDVNQTLRRTLMLFPENQIPREGVSPERFDLRRKTDRQFLRAVHGRLVDGGGIPRELQPEYVRIRQALEGYDRVRHLVQADAVSISFADAGFADHQLFTGDGAAAFFAEDVLLEIPGAAPAPGVELADCQGSDSTDPTHLAQIQDYLVSANLIIYVISSRMGLREADLSFLHMIRGMGMMDNLIFLLNADLGEHADAEGLRAVAAQVGRDLSPVDSRAHLHVCSCLHSLFNSLGTGLPPGEKKRIDLWEQSADLITHVLDGEKKFKHRLADKMEGDRFSLVVENHIQRMSIACDFVGHRICLFSDLLSRDQVRCDHAMADLVRMKAQGERLRAMVRRNTQSVAEVLETEISARIHRFFHPRRSELFQGVKAFILSCDMGGHHQNDRLEASGFNRLLYTMFQVFRMGLDGHMTRWFNPRVAAFIREQEAHIEAHFMALHDTCHVDTADLLSRLNREETTGSRGSSAEPVVLPVDLKAVKGILGLTAPRARFATAYSARIRMDALASLGMQSLVAVLSRFLKRPFASPFSSAFSNAERRIRKEALRSMERHFKNYADTLKNDYFLKMIHAVSRDFQEKLMAEFEGSDLEMAKIEELVAADHTEKKSRRATLDALSQRHDRLSRKLNALDISYPR